MLPPSRQTPSAAPLMPTTVSLCVQVDTKTGADPNWLKQMAEKYNKLSGPFQVCCFDLPSIDGLYHLLLSKTTQLTHLPRCRAAGRSLEVGIPVVQYSHAEQ